MNALESVRCCFKNQMSEGNCWPFKLTAGNVDDRKPIPEMAQSLFGKLFGGRGFPKLDLSSSTSKVWSWSPVTRKI
ncbi:MAG: transposase [Synechococcus sp.]